MSGAGGHWIGIPVSNCDSATCLFLFVCLVRIRGFNYQGESPALIPLQCPRIDHMARNFLIALISHADKDAVFHRAVGAWGGKTSLHAPVGFRRRRAARFIKAQVSLAAWAYGCTGKDRGLAVGAGARAQGYLPSVKPNSTLPRMRAPAVTESVPALMSA